MQTVAGQVQRLKGSLLLCSVSLFWVIGLFGVALI